MKGSIYTQAGHSRIGSCARFDTRVWHNNLHSAGRVFEATVWARQVACVMVAHLENVFLLEELGMRMVFPRVRYLLSERGS